MRNCKLYISKFLLSIVGAVCFVGFLLTANQTFAQTATDIELQLAGSADARDIFVQAKKYHDGDGVEQDFTKARILYQKAANLGDNDARINLGYLYFMGQGVEQSYAEARKWYLIAAKNGDKSAQENLAMMYVHGLGVQRDPAMVKYWREYNQHIKKRMQKLKPSALPDSVQGDRLTSISSTRQSKEKVEVAITQINLPKNKAKISIKPIEDTVNTKANKTPNNNDNFGTNLIKVQTIKQLQPPKILSHSLEKNQNSPYPVWMSNLLASALLLLALVSGVWFWVQFKQIKEQKKAYIFAKSFYAYHRDQLRINYLRYPTQNRKHGDIDDPWAGTLCSLMVKFAQKQKNNQDLVGEQSRIILQALAHSPLKARRGVFPLIDSIQQKIFADIQAHDFKQSSQVSLRLALNNFDRKHRPAAKKHIGNVVNLHDKAKNNQATIPPKSLWPDKPGT